MDEWIALRCNETFVQHYQYSEHGKLLNHDTHIKWPKLYWINLRVDGGPIENYLIPPSLSAGPKAHFLYWPIQKLIECSRSNWNVNSWSHKQKKKKKKKKKLIAQSQFWPTQMHPNYLSITDDIKNLTDQMSWHFSC